MLWGRRVAWPGGSAGVCLGWGDGHRGGGMWADGWWEQAVGQPLPLLPLGNGVEKDAERNPITALGTCS